MGNNPCDDLAIQKEIKKIYTRGNILINNFKHCCNNVKNVLFKTFCSNSFIDIKKGVIILFRAANSI